MKSKLKKIVAAAAFGVFSVGASAAPLSSLYYSQNAGWLGSSFVFQANAAGMVANAPNDGAGYKGDLAPAGTFSQLSWKGITSAPPSSIDITSFRDYTATAQLVGDGDALWEQGEWFTAVLIHQRNNVLWFNDGTTGADVPNPLWNADITSNLYFYGNAGDQAANANSLYEDLGHPTPINFWETLNGLNCPAGFAPLGTKCDDVYSVLNPSAFAPVAFSYNGYNYLVEFDLFPVSGTLVCPSADPRCATVPNDGVLRVFTEEIAPGDSYLRIGMRWTAVPEPSSLLLFSTAVLGLGFAAGRRRKTEQS